MNLSKNELYTNNMFNGKLLSGLRDQLQLPGTNTPWEVASFGKQNRQIDWKKNAMELYEENEIQQIRQTEFEKGHEDAVSKSIWTKISDAFRFDTTIMQSGTPGSVWDYVVRVLFFITDPDNLKLIAIILALFLTYKIFIQ